MNNHSGYGVSALHKKPIKKHKRDDQIDRINVLGSIFHLLLGIVYFPFNKKNL